MKNILIIEDDPAISRGIQASLEGFAYNIMPEPDGEKGFSLALL